MINNLEKILIIFKKPRWPQEFVLSKFSRKYEVESICISTLLNKNNKEIIKTINSIIKNKKISVALFEGDHVSIINFDFINSIEVKKKGLILFDDFMYHETNAITAKACDFILSGCPHSSLKFKKKGYRSLFMPIESDGNIFKKYENIKKKNDVLFFGDPNKHRMPYINHIRNNNINIKLVHENLPTTKMHHDLVKLINESRIVINFSKNEFLKSKYFGSKKYKSYYQFKGRIYQSGLCGTACITEYSPAHELIFKENELINFKTKEECVKILKEILNDSETLENYSKKLHQKCLEFDDKNYIIKIIQFIDSIKSNNLNKKNPEHFPFWYKWIFVKQRLWLRYRNNDLTSFFEEVFDIIFLSKNNSFLEYLLFPIYSLFYSLIFLVRWPLKKFKS
tara:strand:+ start:348 stop:1532 length:1185 start_codon:yes stop_codon:yes gene_type:complete